MSELARSTTAPVRVTRVHLPAQPSGAELAGFIRNTRVAILHGDVVVDADRSTPLNQLVLLRLERLCRRAGRSWREA